MAPLPLAGAGRQTSLRLPHHRGLLACWPVGLWPLACWFSPVVWSGLVCRWHSEVRVRLLAAFHACRLWSLGPKNWIHFCHACVCVPSSEGIVQFLPIQRYAHYCSVHSVGLRHRLSPLFSLVLESSSLWDSMGQLRPGERVLDLCGSGVKALDLRD